MAGERGEEPYRYHEEPAGEYEATLERLNAACHLYGCYRPATWRIDCPDCGHMTLACDADLAAIRAGHRRSTVWRHHQIVNAEPMRLEA